MHDHHHHHHHHHYHHNNNNIGAVIRSKDFKDHCQDKVEKWLRGMESLSEISSSQPHAAYIAFTKDSNPSSLSMYAPLNRSRIMWTQSKK